MPPFEGKLLHLHPAAGADERNAAHAQDYHHHHDHERHGVHEHRHHHDHEQSDGWHSHGPFGRPHRHLPDGGEEVTLKGLLTLGVSGGLLPCPSALVVLLSAIALHRVGFGLLLIVAFSLGLAGVLTGIGLLLAYARRLADRLPVDSGALRFLPVISACAVALMGLAVAVQSLAGGGIIRVL
jgi:ABC-type nickel/cobalt efflux system permease component RcnA